MSRSVSTTVFVAVAMIAVVVGALLVPQWIVSVSAADPAGPAPAEQSVDPVAFEDTPEALPQWPTPAVPSPTPSPPRSVVPSAGPLPTPSSPVTKTPVAKTPEPEPTTGIAVVQSKLKAQKYYLGPIDGEQGPRMASAVMAFQKVNGLSVDGVAGPETAAALDDPVAPTLRGGPATRIEVDLTRQVSYLVKGGELVKIMPVSSGNGSTYNATGGGTARALTPVGWYKIERRISGVRRAPLGVLYDPMYFYHGFALHGSNSVPAYPASHGCVRYPRWDATWVAQQVPNGTPVHLYGGTYTFTAGSSAPGTLEPAGDEVDTSSSPRATPSPSKSAAPSPTPSPSKSAAPSPTPSPSKSAAPSPTPSPSKSAAPSPTPSPSKSADPDPAPSASSVTASPSADAGE